MDAVTVTTPTASTEVHTPPAPAHGFEDSYEPYSPRKSSRLQQKRNVNRTPSPQPSSRHYSTQSLGSPRSRNRKQHHISDMASPPPTSPQKKRFPPESSRRVSGTLTAESTASAAAALGLSLPSETPSKSDSRRGRSAMSRGTGMLPTPAKTPQKPPTEQQRADITKISRNLFSNHSDDDMMPPSKKSRASAYTLDSFSADLGDAPIAIYTDSHERVPEVDTSSSNPFYGNQPVAAGETPKRRSKRHTVSIPGEGRVSVEDAIRRDDGMLIVFRGKKQFRKFAEVESSGPSEGMDEGDGGLEGAVESRLRRPLTRSAIKPRLLFPGSKEDYDTDMAHDDEEAPTDIEDHALPDLADTETSEDLPGTPMETASPPGTPKAPRFAPVSPPTTKRTARHAVKPGPEVTPMKTGKSKGTSPFDQWPRTKSHGHKRPADSQSPAPESAKRTKA